MMVEEYFRDLLVGAEPWAIDQVRTESEVMEDKIMAFKKDLKEFFALLDIEEESDSGNTFHPNRISSCRVMDGMKMNQVLKRLKERCLEKNR